MLLHGFIMWKPHLISKWPPSNVSLPISPTVTEISLIYVLYPCFPTQRTLLRLMLLLLAAMLNVTVIFKMAAFQ